MYEKQPKFNYQTQANRFSFNWLTGILTTAICSLIVSPVHAELSLAEINSIARQTTVLIAPALTETLVDELEENRSNPLENSDGVWNPGSGVILGKEGQKYYVLTVAHNFKQRHLDNNIPFGIRTSDGEVHLVNQINDKRGCPLQEKFIPLSTFFRLGCYSHTEGVKGKMDLAIITFESKNNYAVASMGNVNNLTPGDIVYVSGWPDPEKEKDPETGYCRGKVESRTRRLAWITFTGKINDLSQSQNNYNIFYEDYTRPGMSGGPVFDQNGFVIGIHGRGSSKKGRLIQQYCSIPENKINSTLESEDREKFIQLVSSLQNKTNPSQELYREFSSAQNLNYFASLNNQLPLKIPVQNESYPQQLINLALIPTASQKSEVGVIDFSVDEDLTNTISTTVKPSYSYDVVKNIYSSFTLANMLRDQPSSGCRFLLLGDPCPQN